MDTGGAIKSIGVQRDSQPVWLTSLRRVLGMCLKGEAWDEVG